jgi:hypothetical protein
MAVRNQLSTERGIANPPPLVLVPRLSAPPGKDNILHSSLLLHVRTLLCPNITALS